MAAVAAAAVAAAVAAVAAAAMIGDFLGACVFLPQETAMLPLLFRSLRRSVLLLQQVHAEETLAASAKPAAAAAAAAGNIDAVDPHFLGPREADELMFAAVLYSAAGDTAVAQAAAECLLSLLPLLGLPRGKQQQQQQRQGHLQHLTETLKGELQSLGLLHPICLLRGGEQQQALPCACCCALQQPQQQQDDEGDSSSLNRQPQETAMLLDAAESFFYCPSFSWRPPTPPAAAAAAAAGGSGSRVSLVGRSLLLQRLLKPLLQCLLFSNWHVDIERDCCLCDVEETDPFASQLESVGLTAAKGNSSSNGSSNSSSNGNSSTTPPERGDSNSNNSSASTATSSNSNSSSRILDSHSLLMRDGEYRASRRLCLRVCHLLQCCRYYFPSRCCSVSAPPHPAVILHKQQAAARRRQRRVDWIFFGSLTGGGGETETDTQGGAGESSSGRDRRRRPPGRASVSNLPGINRETALRAIDGVGLIRTVAEFFSHNDEGDEDSQSERHPSAEETENSDAVRDKQGTLVPSLLSLSLFLIHA